MSIRAAILFNILVALALVYYVVNIYVPFKPTLNTIDRVYGKILKASGINEAPPNIVVDTLGSGAYYDGVDIHISNTLLRSLRNEDELALVIAHEFSHALLKHVTLVVQTITFPDTRYREVQADIYGTFLVDKAGYDSCNAAKFWLRLYNTTTGAILNTSSHPSPLQRYHYLYDGRC